MRRDVEHHLECAVLAQLAVDVGAHAQVGEVEPGRDRGPERARAVEALRARPLLLTRCTSRSVTSFAQVTPRIAFAATSGVTREMQRADDDGDLALVADLVGEVGRAAGSGRPDR
jgi:hypothetical protein